MGAYSNYMSGAQVTGSFIDNFLRYEMSRSMQNDMNEYNSPSAQVSRLRAAGISPWMINPQGNTAAQPVMADSNIGSSIGAAADRQIAARQVDSQAKLADAQSEQTKSQTRTIDTLLKYLDESERERIDNQKADTALKNVSTAESAKRISRYDEQVDTDIRLKRAQEINTYAQTDNCKALTNRVNRLLSFEIKEASSRISLNTQQVATLKTAAKLNDKQVTNLSVLMAKSKKEIQKLGIENWASKHSNDIWQKTGVRPGTPAWTAVIDVIGSVINEYLP